MISRVIKTDFNNIDLIKVCMSVLVVATHTSLFSIIDNTNYRDILINALAIKVPFFFVASGFLVWNKIWNQSKDEKLGRLNGWIKKTVRLYIAWTLIYVPYTIYGFYIDDIGVAKSLAVFCRNFLLVGENYLSWPLWYLLGMLTAGCMIYLMVKWNWKNRTMYIVGVIFAVLGVILNYCI